MSSFTRLFDIMMGIRSDAAYFGRVARDPRTPWVARMLIGAALIYAYSPFGRPHGLFPVPGRIVHVVVAPLLFHVGWKLVPSKVRREARFGNRVSAKKARRLLKALSKEA